MQSRSTFSAGGRKSDAQQSRRASAISIPVSILSAPPQPPQPPQPPPPPPRKTANEIKPHRERRTTTFPSKSFSPLHSLVYIYQKQYVLWAMLQQSKYFHQWRREIIYFREAMKTRNERTAALMLSGVNEESLDYLQPTRRKTTKLGISLMRWILVSMTSKNLTRAWRTWVEHVSPSSQFLCPLVTSLVLSLSDLSFQTR
jgi:hypothetical protein